MSHNIRRRDVLKALGASGTVALAGCAGNGGGGDGGGRTLSQGVLMPLSGGLGNLGQPIRDGVHAA